jgi:hypothetical protein
MRAKFSRTVAIALVGIVLGTGALAQVPGQPTAGQPSPDAENPVLLRVGTTEEYRLSDVQAYGKRRPDLVTLLKSTEGLAMVVQEMAMTRALVLEGPNTSERRDATEEGSDKEFDPVYALRVYRNVAGDCPQPSTEQDSRAYYDQNPQAFTVPVQMNLSRVMLPVTAQADGFSAEMWMGLQARAVATGSARFDALVERAQKMAPNLKQGDLGWVLLQVPKRAVEYCRENQKNRVKATLFKRHGVEVDTKAIHSLAAY